MSKELYEKLAAPFPAEAMTEDKSRGFALTSIKAQYVRERLNEVMGVDGWSTHTEVVDRSDKGVAVKMEMTLYFDGKGITRSAYGGCDAKSKGQTYGDLFKSAETDALSKAASNFGVGNDVFKGLVNPNGTYKKGGAKTSTAKPKGPTFPKQAASAPTGDNPFSAPPASQPSFNPENVKKAEKTAGAANPFA